VLKRIIPILLLRDGRCVKGVQFSQNFRDTGNPVSAAKVYDAQKADELIFLDVNTKKEGTKLLYEIITEVAEQCFMPITVGGGIRTLEQVRTLFRVGADKISLNTGAVRTPRLVADASKYYGSQSIVVSIDVKKNGDSYEVYTENATKKTGMKPCFWAKEAVRLGAGELLITSIDREGTMKGYDLKLMSELTKKVNVPVIANGGCGKLHHLKEVFLNAEVQAVAVSSMFHFTDQSTIKARSYLKVEGIDVRPII